MSTSPCLGLSATSVGLLLFVRPGGGFVTSVGMAHFLGRETRRYWPLAIQAGGAVGTASFVLLLLAGEADMDSWTGGALVMTSQVGRPSGVS